MSFDRLLAKDGNLHSLAGVRRVWMRESVVLPSRSETPRLAPGVQILSRFTSQCASHTNVRYPLLRAPQRIVRSRPHSVINTMHRIADQVQAAIALPLLHIADPTAERIRRAGLCKVGLLGTGFTMEQNLYKRRLVERHGLDVLVPGDDDRALVHRESMRNWSRAGWSHPQGKPTARLLLGWWSAEQRRSSWAARRSCCW